MHRSSKNKIPVSSLSFSSISLLERCPQAFFKRYIEGYRSPPTWKMMAGNAFDATINFNYSIKKKEGLDQPLSILKDFMEVQVNNGKDECAWEDGQPKSRQVDNVLFACSKGIEAANRELFPKVNPVSVQEEINFEVRPGVRFIGFIDLVDSPGTVVDNKTTWANWTTGKLWQHIAYEYALRRCIPSDARPHSSTARYDVVKLKKRADPDIGSFVVGINETQLSYVDKKIDWAVNFLEYAGIDKSKYGYNTSSWMCGNSCGHVDRCELELGIPLR